MDSPFEPTPPAWVRLVAGILLMVIGLASHQVHCEGLGYRLSVAAATVASATDLATTVDCTARGICSEKGPVLRFTGSDPVKIALTKTAMFAGTELLIYKLVRVQCQQGPEQCRKARVLGFAANVGLTSVYTWATIHNLRETR